MRISGRSRYQVFADLVTPTRTTTQNVPPASKNSVLEAGGRASKIEPPSTAVVWLVANEFATEETALADRTAQVRWS
jgi:hypothetical protein